MFKKFRFSQNINSGNETSLNDLEKKEEIKVPIHSDRNSKQNISISKRNSKSFTQLFFRNSIKSSANIKKDKSCKVIFDEKTKETMLTPYKNIKNANEKILQIQQERRQELEKLNANNGRNIKNLVLQFSKNGITSI